MSAVSILVALGIFSLLSLPFVEYLTDDTFIFLRYARHLAQGLGLAFNPGEPTYGFTSVLWVWLLSPAFKLGISPIGWAKGLAFLLALGAILGFGAWARKRLSPSAAAAAMVAFAVNGWLVRWTAAAMETALVLALITWGLWRTAVEAEEPGRRPLAALIFAVGVLARPEVALLLVLTIGSDVLRGWITRAVAAAVLAGIVLGPWLGYAHATFGHVLPDTAAAKGRLGALGARSGSAPRHRESARRDQWCGARVDGGRSRHARVAHAQAAPARTPAAPGAATTSDQSLRLADAIPLLWLIGLPLAYVLAGFDVLSRYVLLLTPVVVLYGFLALDRFAGRKGGAARAALVGLVGLVLAQNAWLLARVVYPHTHAFSRGVGGLPGRARSLLCRAHAARIQVAIADIGAFGYYADRPVLDLAGLVFTRDAPDREPASDRGHRPRSALCRGGPARLSGGSSARARALGRHPGRCVRAAHLVPGGGSRACARRRRSPTPCIESTGIAGPAPPRTLSRIPERERETMEAFLGWTAFGIGVLAGLLMIPLGLGGTLVIFGVALTTALVTHWSRVEWQTLVVLGILAVVGEVVESLLGVFVVKRYGASSGAMWGTFLGGIVGGISGTAVLPIAGSLVGAFVGAFLGAVVGELIQRRELEPSMRAGLGALVGRLFAVAVKFEIGVVMVTILVWRIVRNAPPRG